MRALIPQRSTVLPGAAFSGVNTHVSRSPCFGTSSLRLRAPRLTLKGAALSGFDLLAENAEIADSVAERGRFEPPNLFRLIPQSSGGFATPCLYRPPGIPDLKECGQ
jgi:hypothetical protein